MGVYCVLCIGHDITEQRKSESQSRLAASVFESSYEGIMISDSHNRISNVNPAFTRITGYEKDEVIGLDPSLLSSGRHDSIFFHALWKSLEETGSWKGEVWNRRKNGDIYPQLLSISVVKDQNESLLHYVSVFTDITYLKNHAAELEHLARHDALTNIPNRLMFSDRLERAIQESKIKRDVLAVCYLDLDGFKPVNDTLGHAAGDQLLVVVSKRLRQAMRSCDTLARLGGDEFAILLTGLDNELEYIGFVQRILDIIAEPITIQNSIIHISASIGVSLFPRDTASADTLLRHADHAMYHAKKYGKNNYHLFSHGEDQLDLTQKLQQERMASGIENGEFCLYYQPKVDLVTDEVIGFEALLRWHHPQKGILKPKSFLSAIMGTQMEYMIGEWVIEQALGQLQYWQQQELHLMLGFNVSANHLMRPGFSTFLGQALKRHPDVDSKCLILEFQESIALDDVEAAQAVLNHCRSQGVKVALDDFGTGYSSLSYLKKLPIDILKIDRSFVHDIIDDQDSRGLISNIIQLAKTLKLQVIAEGIESKAQGNLLLALGCSLVQGNAIAKPMPAERVIEWLEAR